MPAVSGTVKDANGNFARRLVRVHRRDTGSLVGETLSNPSTGAWSVATADTSKHYAVAHDSDAWITYLPFNGDNGSTTIPEWGGKTVTAYGNAQISTAQSKFGGSSAYFDGSGDYLAIPSHKDFDILGGDLTLEFWVKTNNTADTSSAILCLGNASGTYAQVLIRSNYFGINSNNGTNRDLTVSGVTMDTGWHHFAWVRSGGVDSLFWDGVKKTTSGVGPVSLSNYTLFIGANFLGGSYSFNGYLDDLRISKGVARYITDFTPPTAPHFTQQDGDPWWGNVVLGCHFNSGETPTFKDVATGKAITANGNAAISTAQSKFGGASLVLDGSGDYFTVASHADFSFGSGDFTIEGFFYEHVAGAIRQIVGRHSTSANTDSAFLVLSNNQKLEFSIYAGSSAYTVANAAAHTLDAWHHFAAVRSGAAMYLFLDGALVGSRDVGSNAVNSVSQPVSIGAVMANGVPNAAGYYFNGYIDDLRITKGIARYVSNFTPPAAAFPEQLLTFGQKNAVIYDHLTPV